MKMIVCAAALMISGSAMAQTWNEIPDAGDLPATAQLTQGFGALTLITGSLLDDVDMYAIIIDDHANFSAINTAYTGSDTQLFLFDSAGMGVVFNDDFTGLLAGLDGTHVVADGLYYLAIGDYDCDALNPGGLDIWHDGSPYSGQYAPDGPGAPGPVASWNYGVGSGDYEITLTGATFAVPAPGALALLGLAGLVSRRRR